MNNRNNNNNNNKNEIIIDKKKLFNDFTTAHMVSDLSDADFLYKKDKYYLGDIKSDTIIWIRFEKG